MAIGIRAHAEITDADPTGLLTKYALTKVAMVVIATAAAAGTILSTVVGGNRGYLQAGARYLLLMGTGRAAGVLLRAWKVVGPAAHLVGGPDCEAYAPCGSAARCGTSPSPCQPPGKGCPWRW